jgi:hypothetical protein
MLLWLLFNFLLSLVFMPKLSNYTNHIFQPLKPSILHHKLGFAWFKKRFCLFLFYLIQVNM